MSSDDQNNVNQSNNTAGGDFAGRDVNKNIYNTASKSKTGIRELAERFASNSKNDDETAEFIEILQHYMSDITRGPVRGLEEKLISGEREYLVDYALLCKERFAKLLTKYQFNSTAQIFYAHCLAKIRSKFFNQIMPKINSNESIMEIDSFVYKEIIESLHDEIGGEIKDITPCEIEGMLYYLAGNCHIDWKKK